MKMIVLSQVKAGDEFFECELGKNQHLRAITDARHLEELNGQKWNGWCVEALRLPQNERIVLLESGSEGIQHKLKIYDEPMYLTKEKTQKTSQTVYMMCGLPGSGKSNWAKAKLDELQNCVIINKDSLRTMVRGGTCVYDLNFEEYIKEISIMAILRALQRGYSVIIDETYITKEKRKGTISAIKCQFPEVNIICVHCIDDKRSVEMRMKDYRGMAEEKWRSVIEKMRAWFEKPTTHEGFDKIEYVRTQGDEI